MRSARACFVGLATLLALAPSVVAAQGQTCVLLPPPDDSSAPADAHARVDVAITEELREHGLVVMASRDAQLRMSDQPMENCSAIDCAPEVNRYLGTSFAVLTELTWLRGRPTMINVVLIGLDDGASAGGQVVIERGADLADSVRQAFSIAWDRWQADSQGQLVIDTTPAGAFVEIDGASVGRAPLRHLVPAGVHTVRVTLEGYQGDTREVTVDRHEERPISITLAAATASVEVTTAPEEPQYDDHVEPHWANWVIGGVGLAAAIGLAISPVMTAASEGTVTDRGAAGTDTVYFGEQSIALALVSGAVLIGSVVWLVLHPIEEHTRVPRSGVSVHASLGGLEVTW